MTRHKFPWGFAYGHDEAVERAQRGSRANAAYPIGPSGVSLDFQLWQSPRSKQGALAVATHSQEPSGLAEDRASLRLSERLIPRLPIAPGGSQSSKTGHGRFCFGHWRQESATPALSLTPGSGSLLPADWSVASVSYVALTKDEYTTMLER